MRKYGNIESYMMYMVLKYDYDAPHPPFLFFLNSVILFFHFFACVSHCLLPISLTSLLRGFHIFLLYSTSSSKNGPLLFSFLLYLTYRSLDYFRQIL
jgi:hypothetical protein